MKKVLSVLLISVAAMVPTSPVAPASLCKKMTAALVVFGVCVVSPAWLIHEHGKYSTIPVATPEQYAEGNAILAEIAHIPGLEEVSIHCGSKVDCEVYVKHDGERQGEVQIPGKWMPAGWHAINPLSWVSLYVNPLNYGDSGRVRRSDEIREHITGLLHQINEKVPGFRYARVYKNGNLRMSLESGPMSFGAIVNYAYHDKFDPVINLLTSCTHRAMDSAHDVVNALTLFTHKAMDSAHDMVALAKKYGVDHVQENQVVYGIVAGTSLVFITAYKIFKK